MSIKVTFEFDEATGQLLSTSLDGGAAQPTEAAAPAKRGRGRPVKGEESAAPVASATPAATPSTTPAASPAAQEVDPFEAKPGAPKATLQQVRAAWNALKAATDQDTAMKVLKDVGGASNGNDLKPEKYDVTLAALEKALPPVKTAPVPEADPFETVATPAAVATSLTIEDVKKAAAAAGKKTSQEAIQKVVMNFGGKAQDGTGKEGPSLKALAEKDYAAVIAAINALPTTK